MYSYNHTLGPLPSEIQDLEAVVYAAEHNFHPYLKPACLLGLSPLRHPKPYSKKEAKVLWKKTLDLAAKNLLIINHNPHYWEDEKYRDCYADDYVIGKPSNVKAITKILQYHRSINDEFKNKEYWNKYHLVLGKALGYSNEAIQKFIDNK